VCVNDEVICLFAFDDDVFEDASTKGMQPLHRDIKNFAGRYVRCFGIHHIADIAQQHLVAFVLCGFAYLLQIALLVNADHACDDNNHHEFPILRFTFAELKAKPPALYVKIEDSSTFLLCHNP